MFAIIRTRWQTRPLSCRARRRSSAAPGSLRKKYAGIAYPPNMVRLPNHSTTSGNPRKPVLERVRAAQPPGARVEIWFQDEARIGQKNSLTRVWGQTGSRPVAPKDLGFASAYVFGAVCPLQGKAAALIMPICNTAAMNHHLCEISSQVTADAHAVVILDG